MIAIISSFLSRPQRAAAEGAVSSTKVLVCAQSNAAVDEIVHRLDKEGAYKPDGMRETPTIVRFGTEDAMAATSRSFSINASASKLFSPADVSCRDDVANNRSRRQQLNEIIDKAQTEVARLGRLVNEQEADQEAWGRESIASGSVPQHDSVNAGSNKTVPVTTENKPLDTEAMRNRGLLAAAREEVNAAYRELKPLVARIKSGEATTERQRRSRRVAAVRGAQVVAATLIGSGGELRDLLPADHRFDVVIMDEAAQALEPAALVAVGMVSAEGQVVLVGDPQQLPPTVLSRSAVARHLSQSLFERLQKVGYPVAMLTEQYRMHPTISSWPSRFFYGGRITDHAGLAAARKAAWHQHSCFTTAAFYDCTDGKEGSGALQGGSLANQEEAILAAQLFQSLHTNYHTQMGSVAVLSPYRAQLTVLRRAFGRPQSAAVHLRHSYAAALADVQFSTVDGFQGREADIVIFSCVRSSGGNDNGKEKGIGFLSDVRRMNVGLTRARSSLWIVGNAQTLKRESPEWADLLADMRKRNRLYVASAPYDGLIGASHAVLTGKEAAVTQPLDSRTSRKRSLEIDNSVTHAQAKVSKSQSRDKRIRQDTGARPSAAAAVRQADRAATAVKVKVRTAGAAAAVRPSARVSSKKARVTTPKLPAA